MQWCNGTREVWCNGTREVFSHSLGIVLLHDDRKMFAQWLCNVFAEVWKIFFLSVLNIYRDLEMIFFNAIITGLYNIIEIFCIICEIIQAIITAWIGIRQNVVAGKEHLLMYLLKCITVETYVVPLDMPV